MCMMRAGMRWVNTRTNAPEGAMIERTLAKEHPAYPDAPLPALDALKDATFRWGHQPRIYIRPMDGLSGMVKYRAANCQPAVIHSTLSEMPAMIAIFAASVKEYV